MCAKVAYLTKREAKRALASTAAARERGIDNRREIRHYHSPYCGLHHLTSQTEETP